MIDRNLDHSQAREAIGLLKTDRKIVLTANGHFSSNLRKVLARMGSATKSSIDRATGNLINSWRNTRVPSAIDDATRSLHGIEYDPRLLKHLAFEWAQNGVEHGGFDGDVIVETIGGDNGILVSVSDNGSGIPNLDQKIELDNVRYEAEGFPMGRGYGLQGAKDTEEVIFGFDQNANGFRVNMLVTVEQLEKVTRRRMERMCAMQSYR